MSSFASGLWDTKPLSSGGGYVYTLTSRISEMLVEVEKLFGARDMSWSILGAEINMDGDTPQNWYPGGAVRKHIVFQLVPPADRDVIVACYQLAHEVVHSLAPLIDKPANVLEEGLATWYSREYIKKNFCRDILSGGLAYDDACRRVGEFLELYPHGIKQLRAVEPCFKSMTEFTFAEAGIELSQNAINALVAPFER